MLHRTVTETSFDNSPKLNHNNYISTHMLVGNSTKVDEITFTHAQMSMHEHHPVTSQDEHTSFHVTAVVAVSANFSSFRLYKLNKALSTG